MHFSGLMDRVSGVVGFLGLVAGLRLRGSHSGSQEQRYNLGSFQNDGRFFGHPEHRPPKGCLKGLRFKGTSLQSE